MKLVKFPNGTYGVMRVRWWGRKEFLSASSDWWWSKPKEIAAFCQMDRARAELLAGIWAKNVQVIE